MTSPILTLPQIPQSLEPELRDYLSNMAKILINKQKEEYGTIEKRIIDRLYPVGERYVQFPEPDGSWSEAKSPEVKFGGEWVCIFANEGVFFRTEGDPYGEGQEHQRTNGKQADQFQNHRVAWINYGYSGSASQYGHTKTDLSCAGGVQTNISAWVFANIAELSPNGVPRTGKETRPINRLMKIWERIA